MDLYSVTLGLALVAAMASLGLALLGRVRSGRLGSSLQAVAGVGRAAGGVGIGALVLVSLSSLSHLIVGHPPGSPSALGLVAFFDEHPAFVAIAIVAIAALIVVRIARPVTRHVEGGRWGA